MIDVKGKISNRLYEYVNTQCLESEYSDITFCVENERFPAHRLILASNEYFRALLYGHYAENKQKEIELPVPASPFKALLKYIYSDCISLGDKEFGEIIAILRLAHMYGFSELTAAIISHLEREMSLGTVCEVLAVSQQLSIDSLCEACLKFWDGNAYTFLLHETFTDLSQESLCALLQRETFVAPEVQIFEAIQAWSMKKCVDAADLHAAVFQVRLPRLTDDQLLGIMLSGLMDHDLINKAIKFKVNSNAQHAPVNLASDKTGAKVIVGNEGDQLLNDNITIYNELTGFSYHISTSKIEEALTVDLGSISMINHIRILLWDAHVDAAFKYNVEVSIDNCQWDRVIDHSQYFCRSWQHLYFPLRIVRYIRYFGTESVERAILGPPGSQVFAVVSLQAFQIPISIVPYLHNGVAMPKNNVATKDHGAIVLSGKNRTGLIYSNSVMSSAEAERNDYTSHPFSKGEILVRLGQPYYIGSIRLKLRNTENRKYRFYIQTSVDNVNWTMAVDMRNNDISSSSTSVFKFTQRLVIYVKIIGTKCSIIEVKEFCCVRFECPANQFDETTAIEGNVSKTMEESKTE